MAKRKTKKKKGKGNLPALEKYWDKTVGTDPKKGQFGRFMQRFARTKGEFDDPAALSAWWHKHVTGMWPAEKYTKMGWKRKKRKFGKKKKKMEGTE